MGLFFRLVIFAVLGVLVGALTALWFGGLIPGGPRIGNAIEIDNWRSDWSIGSESADSYVRARVARNGLMGLRKEEAVYFLTTEDVDGNRLSDACTYRISGGALPARWWSITLYDADNRLPMNVDGRLSFDQTQAEDIFEDASRAWEVQVSATPPEEIGMPGISSREGGEFDLTLRLYQPSDALLANPEATLVPPQIERLTCQEGTS